MDDDELTALEGACISGRSRDELEAYAADRDRRFWRHVDHCAACQDGTACAKLDALVADLSRGR